MVVAELVPAVVEWNRGVLGAAADYPLKDPRVRIEERDVAVTIGSGTAAFDAILLDVDNGPAAMTTASNGGLLQIGTDWSGCTPHSSRGASLRYGLRVTRAGFERTLRAAGFEIRREHVRGGTNKRGARHTILVASPIDAIE